MRLLDRFGLRHGGRGERDQEPPPTCPAVLLTSVVDDLAHVVTDDVLSSPEAIRTGQYPAVCGHVVIPAPLIAPDGERCRRCRCARAGQGEQ